NYERDPALRAVRPSYAFILDRIGRSLSDLLPGIARQGTSDLAAGDRKFSGNAQQRKQRFLLHHGTLLYDFDLARVERYLRSPARQPDYRASRHHRDFLCNLPATADELKRRLVGEWQATAAASVWPRDLVARLLDEKYRRDGWNRRR